MNELCKIEEQRLLFDNKLQGDGSPVSKVQILKYKLKGTLQFLEGAFSVWCVTC